MSRWHRLEGVADLPDRAFSGIKIGGRVRVTLEGGGSGQTSTSTGTTTSYQSNLPEFAEPYYKSMMARTQDESVTPFQEYTGDRVADFSTAQKGTQADILGMTPPTGLADARAGFKDVAAGAKGASFAPGTFTPGYTAGTVAPGYTASTLTPGYTSGTVAPGYTAGTVAPGYTAGTVAPGYTAGTATPGYTASTLTPGYTAGTVAPGYTAGTATPSYTAGTMAAPEFNTAQAAKYMSPYQQNVIDVEKREATRQGDMAQLGINAAAQKSGAFGGARHGVVAAERYRDLSQQLGDIQTRGQQQAYDRAATQFGSDRAASMEATGKTQGFQQVQSQMGLTASQQNEAAQQRQAALGLTASQQNEAAKQRQAQLGLTAQQQTEVGKREQAQLGLTSTQQNEAAKQRQAALGLTASQQNEAAQQRQAALGLTASQQNEAAQQRQAALGLDAFKQNEMAKQQQAQLGLTAQQQTEAARQRQAALGLTASQQNEAAKQQQARLGLTAQTATEESRQFGAKFDQANRDQQIKVGAAQAGLAKSQQGLDAARFNLQNAVGADQRKLAQQNLDKAFDDFVNKRDYERQQLSFYNSMLRGIEVGEQREIRNMAPAPSAFGQVAGAGLGALGAYNAFKG